MDSIIYRLFIFNWQRKAVALISAIVVWLFVNASITDTKTLPNVPIRIVNLPSDKTIQGLLPNRLLSKRITLTLRGTKDIIQELEPGDLEVLLDVSTADSNDWVVQVSKKNLVSLNPSIDLAHHITEVFHPEFVLKLSPLVTDKIPITILTPTGTPPTGYEFLDIWPQKLMQTVSGSQEEIDSLKAAGLELTLHLGDISKADLDALHTPSVHDDEISYLVPDKWKRVAIPFHNNALEEINDADTHDLSIAFLRKSFLKINNVLPIRVFYPLQSSEKINPKTYPLAINDLIQQKNEVTIFTMPLYVRDVSHLFLDVVREDIEIAIVAAPKEEREILHWSLEVIDPSSLEDTYVAFVLTNAKDQPAIAKRQEGVLRKRFRDYMQRLTLFSAPEQPLHLESRLDLNNIKVHPLK